MNELYSSGLKALLEHLPAQQAWVTAAIFGVAAIGGITMLARGAKLAAPAVVFGVGLLFAGLGLPLAKWAAMNPIATSAVCGAVGLLVGSLFFRFWLAVVVAACFVAVSLGIYTDRALSPHLQSYLSRNYDATSELVTLPGADAAAAAAPTTGWGVLADLWSHLSSNVQQFQLSFGAIVAVMTIAGLLVGWKAPNLSRSIGAATLGTGITLTALTALLDWYWPTALAQLKSAGNAGWIGIAAIWLVSLIQNYRSITPKKKNEKASENPDHPRPMKPAVSGHPI